MVLAGRCLTNTAAVGIPNVGARESWQDYPVGALHTVSELANELGVEKHLHLWPDKSLDSQSLADRMLNPRKYLKRLEHWWHRVSEWPN